MESNESSVVNIRNKNQMINISTKKGDKGKTELASGKRLSKDSLVFEAIGGVDELNSWLGLVLASMKKKYPAQRTELINVQRVLFSLGADLAQVKKSKFELQALIRLEEATDELQQSFSSNWLTQFVLPGGTELSARLDLARAVCRRVERVIVGFQTGARRSKTIKPINAGWLKYLNRLSDYLFVLRCFLNQENKTAEQKAKY